MPTLLRNSCVSILLLACSAGFAQLSLGQPESDPGTSSSAFGQSLAATGKHLWVGAPGFDREGVPDTGWGFAFDLKTLLFTNRLDMGVESGASAGLSAAASKTEIIFGMPGRTLSGQPAAGAVFYYNEKVGNSPTIENPVSDANDLFGWSAAMNKTSMVIGAPNDFFAGAHSGSASIVPKVNFAPQALPIPEYNAGDEIGAAVAMSTKLIAIGAPGWSGGAGRVYVFDAKTRLHLRTLSIGGSLFNVPHFGSALVFSGKYLFVGAPDDDYGLIGFPGYASSAGSVTQYDTKTWEAVRTLRALVPEGGAGFGGAIHADKKRVVVGSPKRLAGGIERGNAELFDIKTGVNLREFTSPAPINGERFGTAVLLLKGNRVVIGAPAPNLTTRDGNVYAFEL